MKSRKPGIAWSTTVHGAGEDGESGDAMTPNEEEQEHDEQGGA